MINLSDHRFYHFSYNHLVKVKYMGKCNGQAINIFLFTHIEGYSDVGYVSEYNTVQHIINSITK